MSYRPRQYGYGVIKKAITTALADGKPHKPSDIIAELVGKGIDPQTAWSNLRALRSTGLIDNIGTRRAALYVLPKADRS